MVYLQKLSRFKIEVYSTPITFNEKEGRTKKLWEEAKEDLKQRHSTNILRSILKPSFILLMAEPFKNDIQNHNFICLNCINQSPGIWHVVFP